MRGEVVHASTATTAPEPKASGREIPCSAPEHDRDPGTSGSGMTSVASLEPLMREVDLATLTARGAIESVYVLIHRDQVIYVGRTVGLISRLSSHMRGGRRAPPKVFDRALSIELPAEDAHACEGALIRRFCPRFCIGAPTDDGRDAEMLQRFGLEPDLGARNAFDMQRSTPRRRLRELAKRHRRSPTTSSTIWKSTKRWLKREASRQAVA